jgi:hypothetical protein
MQGVDAMGGMIPNEVFWGGILFFGVVLAFFLVWILWDLTRK